MQIPVKLLINNTAYGFLAPNVLVTANGNAGYANSLLLTDPEIEAYDGNQIITLEDGLYEYLLSKFSQPELVQKFRADQRRNAMGQFAPEGVGGGDGVREVTEFDFEESESKSPNNPGILDDKGVKFWVDGQFIGSKYQQVGNDILRHTMEGQLGLRLSPYAARYQGEVQGKAPRSDQEIAEMSTNLIVSLDAAKPAQPVLYRGMHKPTTGGDGSESQYQEILDLRVGDELATPMFSTTRNLDTAKMYSNFNSRGTGKDIPIIFKIEAGSKGLKTSIVPMDAEVLSGGKFKVKDVVNLKYPAIRVDSNAGAADVVYKTARIITIQQVATFSAADIEDPSFTPDPEMAVDDFGWSRGRK